MYLDCLVLLEISNLIIVYHQMDIEWDHGAMSHDLDMGKSKNEVIDKCNRGGYDVKK